MNDGDIQQIGTRPISTTSRNAFVADFIGETNIIDGVMHKDFLVEFWRDFACVDRGFEPGSRGAGRCAPGGLRGRSRWKASLWAW